MPAKAKYTLYVLGFLVLTLWISFTIKPEAELETSPLGRI